jgi:hypothetical protein
MWRLSASSLALRLVLSGLAGLPCLPFLPCLSACSERDDLKDPRDPTATQAAADRFRTDYFCPIDRIAATRLVPMPRAPAEIADDPERYALWEDTWKMRAITDPRMLVRVDGCGARKMYTCWEFSTPGGVNTTGRGSRRVVWGATCLEENGYTSEPTVRRGSASP